MRDLIVVGAGEVFEKNWLPAIRKAEKSGKVRLVGIVEPQDHRRRSVALYHPSIWAASSLRDIPDYASRDTIVLVLTPDHFSVVQEIAMMGFKNIIVEKPLVSRDYEIPLFLDLVAKHRLKLYAVDMYIPKMFSFGMVCGTFSVEDPRVALFSSGPHCDLPLGRVEGISVSVIEGGDLGVPSLLRRPWLLNDPEIGGMLRDLGTHVFAPLANVGLLGPGFKVSHVALAKLTADRSDIEPVTNRTDVETYVAVQLAWNDIPIHAVFGKLPQQGGEWSISVRGSKGMFFAGLRSGQPAVVLSNNGATSVLQLSVSSMEFVLEEILMFYGGLLPSFDGNLGAIRTSLEINRKIRDVYFSSR